MQLKRNGSGLYNQNQHEIRKSGQKSQRSDVYVCNRLRRKWLVDKIEKWIEQQGEQESQSIIIIIIIIIFSYRNKLPSVSRINDRLWLKKFFWNSKPWTDAWFVNNRSIILSQVKAVPCGDRGEAVERPWRVTVTRVHAEDCQRVCKIRLFCIAGNFVVSFWANEGIWDGCICDGCICFKHISVTAIVDGKHWIYYYHRFIFQPPKIPTNFVNSMTYIWIIISEQKHTSQ